MPEEDGLEGASPGTVVSQPPALRHHKATPTAMWLYLRRNQRLMHREIPFLQ
jgi:hypothetical protein